MVHALAVEHEDINARITAVRADLLLKTTSDNDEVFALLRQTSEARDVCGEALQKAGESAGELHVAHMRLREAQEALSTPLARTLFAQGAAPRPPVQAHSKQSPSLPSSSSPGVRSGRFGDVSPSPFNAFASRTLDFSAISAATTTPNLGSSGTPTMRTTPSPLLRHQSSLGSLFPSSAGASSASPHLPVSDYRVHTSAGISGVRGFEDGSLSVATFNNPYCIVELPNGDFLVTESLNNSIRVISVAGIVRTIIGRAGSGYVDGDVETARLNRPRGMCVYRDGSILIADTGNNCIRRLAPNLRTITTIAGSENFGFRDGVGAAAQFRMPTALALHPDGSVIVADRGNYCLRRLVPSTSSTASLKDPTSWTVELFAGRGGFPGQDPRAVSAAVDGGALTDARIAEPIDVLCVRDGTVLFLEARSQSLRCVSEREVKTLASPTFLHFPVPFQAPAGLARRKDGVILVTDTQRNQIFALDLSDHTFTIAAGAGERGAQDGLGASALLSGPSMITRCTTKARFVFCDTLSNRIRILRLPLTKARAALSIQRAWRRSQSRVEYSQTRKTFLEQLHAFFAEFERHQRLCQSVITKFEACCLKLEAAKHAGRGSAFREALRRILEQHRQSEMGDGLLKALIQCSPTVADLSALLATNTGATAVLTADVDSVRVCQAVLGGRLRTYRWPRNVESLQRDVLALVAMSDVHGSRLLSEDVLTSVFRNERFTADLNDVSLALVAFAITTVERLRGAAAHDSGFHVDSWSRIQCTLDVPHVAVTNPVKRALAQWIPRIVSAGNPRAPFRVRLLAILELWSGIASRFFTSEMIAKLALQRGRPSADLSAHARTSSALAWLMRIHLEDLCTARWCQPFLHSLGDFAEVGAEQNWHPLLRYTLLDIAKLAIHQTPTEDVMACLLPDHVFDEPGCVCDSQWFCLEVECGRWNRNEWVPAAQAYRSHTNCEGCGAQRPASLKLAPCMHRGASEHLSVLPPLSPPRLALLAELAEWVINQRLRSDYRGTLILSRLISQACHIWARLSLLYWFVLRTDPAVLSAGAPKQPPPAGESQQKTYEREREEASKRYLAQSLSAVVSEFQLSQSALLEARSSIGFVTLCFTHRSILLPLWHLLGSKFDEAALSALNSRATDRFALLQHLKSVVSETMEDATFTNTVQLAESSWKTLTLRHVEWFFRALPAPGELSPAERYVEPAWEQEQQYKSKEEVAREREERALPLFGTLPLQVPLIQLPVLVLSAFEWIYPLLRSSLFIDLWERCTETVFGPRVRRAEQKPAEAKADSDDDDANSSGTQRAGAKQPKKQLTPQEIEELRLRRAKEREEALALAARIDGQYLDVLTRFRDAWTRLYQSLTGRTAVVTDLISVSAHLANPSELALLGSTAPSADSWTVTPANTDWLEATKTVTYQWRHIEAVHNALAGLQKSVEFLAVFISHEGRHTLEPVAADLAVLAEIFSRKWSDDQLSGLIAEVWPIAERIDPFFVQLDTKLVELMADSLDLLDWLRTMPVDADFTSSIEMALGRAEHDCPVELWVQNPGETGHPDEKVLSMVMNVRAFFHPFLYRNEDRLPSFSACLDLLRQLEKPDKRVLDGLKTCSELRLPLMELLDQSTEMTSVNRLLNLMQPSRNSFWACTNVPGAANSAKFMEEATALAKLGGQGDFAVGDLTIDDAVTEEPDSENSAGAEAETLWLAYTVPRRGTYISRKLDMNNLLDFQSNVVLAKTIQRGAETQHTIEHFVLQLAWMRQSSATLHQLSQAGHFLFQRYKRIVPIATDPSELYSTNTGLRALLSRWNDQVLRVRQQHYYVNFFNMKQIGKLVAILSSPRAATDLATSAAQPEAADQRKGKGKAAATAPPGLIPTLPSTAAKAAPSTAWPEALQHLQQMLHCINPDFGTESETVLSIASQLVKFWQSAEAAEAVEDPRSALPPAPQVHGLPDDAKVVRQLKLCAVAMDAVFSQAVPIRTRPVGHDLLPGEAVVLEPGVHLVCAEQSSTVVYHVLSMYSRAAHLPERDCLLLCTPHTLAEDITNLLLRWRTAHLNGRGNRLFCIASTEMLSFELQHHAVTAIRDAAMLARTSLVLVSGTVENQHIVSQYAQTRLALPALSLEELRGMGTAVSAFAAERAGGSGGVRCYTSRRSGAGKTFAIRRAAAAEERVCVSVPINGPIGPTALLRRITTRTAAALAEVGASLGSARIALHFDLADPVPSAFSAFIFELCFMGGITDSSTGSFFSWDTRTTSVNFEIATGRLITRLRVGMVLPQTVISATADSFIASRDVLAAGMGRDFDSSHFDGTYLLKRIGAAPQKKRRALQAAASAASAASDSSSQLALGEQEEGGVVNAHRRLQYVAAALLILNEHRGFPFTFDGPAPGAPDVPGPQVFDLLIKATRHKPGNVSFWSLWNFVNVFYWEVKEMHHPESPVNCACMPDMHAAKQDDILVKGQIKAEVIRFLAATATEFATRESQGVEEDRITSMTVNGFQRIQFNGFWERTPFDVDGKMCFRSGSLFLYYRNRQKQWVIDDVIQPTGAVFSSSTNSDMTSAWSTSPSWAQDPRFRVEAVRNTAGHNGEAYKITGGKSRAGDEHENGIYLRQPPYDDIHGRPHYIMTTPLRRHLFWSAKESLWQIAPVCTDEEGAYALSVTSNITGLWQTMPADIVDANVRFTYYRAGGSTAPTGAGSSSGTKNTEQTATDQDQEESLNAAELEGMRLQKWNDSNHECLLFSNENHVVTFLSLDPKKLRSKMHPQLLQHLEQNNINVGEDLDRLNARYYEVLSVLTGVHRNRESAGQLLGGKYCLTGDSLIKMLAIFVRIRCGIPVLLMGECGCGKTMLIRYLCAWLNVKLLVLDVHGGTTVADILNIFAEAERVLRDKEATNVYLFLDEINTCAHMGLITEAICSRSLNGVRFSPEIQILAALNPYRKKTKMENEGPGLVFQLKKSESIPDPMSSLVYRVHPVPHTLQDFIFDFGSLSENAEQRYIRSMVEDKIKELGEKIEGFGVVSEEIAVMSEFIYQAQQFVRDREGDESAASLRDVRRVLQLLDWFLLAMTSKKDESKLYVCMLMSVAHVYYYRLPDEDSRSRFWRHLRFRVEFSRKGLRGTGWAKMQDPGFFEKVLQQVQKKFCQSLELGDEIALNNALMENLFVVIVCIFNKIPIFVVGKPGSSKTLTMQIIASNLQGKQSPNAFWRRFPSVYVFQYQCSPMSSSESIQYQFDMAKNYQNFSRDVVTVLLLDEVGLAEHSPDMPLKVLHGILVEPPIAIVGLSNWVLDPAKMNRAICLHRTEPTQDDIHLTGQRIFEVSASSSSAAAAATWLQAVAMAYHQVYEKQKGRDFIGMRDFYHLIKLLRKELVTSGKDLSPQQLLFALCRNFGGKKEILDHVVATFYKSCFSEAERESFPPAPSLRDLIQANLTDKHSRHLMLITINDAALPLVLGCKLLSEKDTTVLIGSQFKEDASELQLVQQINEVKNAMAAGTTVVLLNHDNIYEALYDVLNQRYLYKTDERSGKIKKMLRLAIGSRSQLCPVEDGFKIVVIAEQRHVYEDLDLPLLNRFEKQILTALELLGTRQIAAVRDLSSWCESILQETGLDNYQAVFCGFTDDTIPSLVLNLTNYNDEYDADSCLGFNLARPKRMLAATAMPIAMMHSTILQDALASAASGDSLLYFRRHADLAAILDNYVTPAPAAESDDMSADRFTPLPGGALCVVLTHSPSSHLHMALSGPAFAERTISVLQLAELSSEKQLVTRLHDFLEGGLSPSTKTPALLVVQCDPIACSPSLINHARYLCVQQRSRLYTAMVPPASRERHVVFLVHLPPGAADRVRFYPLSFHPPWSYVFVDDLRSDSQESLSTLAMLQQSALDLVQSQRLSVRQIIRTGFQFALSSCVPPQLTPTELSHLKGVSLDQLFQMFSYVGRIKLVQRLLGNLETETPGPFYQLVETFVTAVLEANNHVDSKGMHSHVSMVCRGDFVGGSLRQSLVAALKEMVLRAVSVALQDLDVNFNIHLLDYEPEATVTLWYTLARTENVLDPKMAARRLSSAALLLQRLESAVPNTGRSAPLVAQFPFSTRVQAVLGTRETRQLLERGSSEAEALDISHIDATATSLFGPEVVAAWTKFAAVHGGAHIAYLADYTATSAPSFPGLSNQQQSALYEAAVRLTAQSLMQSPLGIHAALWVNETRLFHICSLLSSPFLNQTSRSTGSATSQTFLDRVVAAVSRLASDHASIQRPRAERLSQLEACVLGMLFEWFWVDVEQNLPTHPDRYEDFLRTKCDQIGQIQADVESLLVMLEEHSSSAKKKATQLWGVGTADDLFNMWAGLRLFRIMAQEVYTLVAPETFRTVIVSLLRDCNPGSFGYYTRLVEALRETNWSWVDGGRDLISHVLRRYLSDVVFGVRGNPTVTARMASVRDPDFAAEALQIVEGFLASKDNAPPAQLRSGAPWDFVMLPLRRSLLLDLIMSEREVQKQQKAEAQAQSQGLGKEKLRERDKLREQTQLKFRTVEGALLFLQYAQDRFAELSAIQPLEGRLTVEVISQVLGTMNVVVSGKQPDKPKEKDKDKEKEKGKGKAGAASAPEAVDQSASADQNTMFTADGLTALAIAQNCFTRFAQSILRAYETGTLFQLVVPPVLKQILEKHREAPIYVLKHLRSQGGIDLLADLLQAPVCPALEWVPRQTNLRAAQHSVDSPTLADPFPWLLESKVYTAIVAAVRQSVMGSGNAAEIKQRIDDRSRSTWATVLAALYTQIIPNRAQLNPGGVENLASVVGELPQPLPHLYRWVVRGCPLYAEHSFVSIAERTAHESQMQVLMHAVTIGVRLGDDSWFHALVFNPGGQAKSFIPSMPDDEMNAILSAMAGVGWYVCPNGHPYSVGECTMPMQKGRCITCHAVVGGESHVSVSGVRKVQNQELAASQAKPGYMPDSTHGRSAENVARQANRATVRLLRFILHGLLRVSMCLSPGIARETGYLMPRLGPGQCWRHLTDRMNEDWEALRDSTGLGHSDLAVALHIVLNRYSANPSLGRFPAVISNGITRMQIEGAFQTHCVTPVLSSGLRASIETARSQMADTQRAAEIRLILGDGAWQRLLESENFATAPSDRILWRKREAVSYAHFQRMYSVLSDAKNEYPLLHAFLAVETTLPIVQYAADILAWHAILFEIFPNNVLTREEAAQITNQQAIERLPERDRPQAQAVLARFCEGFNRALPRIEFLYECQANPFRSRDGTAVDLSGTGTGNVQMGPDTPISFSLPSMVQGETDAQGLCTIQLLNLLQNSHNTLLIRLSAALEQVQEAEQQKILEAQIRNAAAAEAAAIQAAQKAARKEEEAAVRAGLRRAGERMASTVPFMRAAEARESDSRPMSHQRAQALAEQQAQEQQQQQQQQAAQEEEEAEAAAPQQGKFIPAFNYRTPPTLVRQQLIVYDRETHFLPLLGMFALQRLEYGMGDALSYDWARIQEGLRHTVLAGKREIQLQVRHYQFQGELRRSGQLTTLHTRIPQEELPPSLLKAIRGELDTVHRLKRMFGFLEDCVGFLVSVGGASIKGIDGSMALHRYAREVLLVPEEMWEKMVTPSIRDRVYLSNLRSLIVCIEEALFDGPLDRIHHTYREELPEALSQMLREAMTRMPTGILAPMLRELITSQLGNGNFPAEAQLKEYLGFVAEEDYPWLADHFPEELQLKHAAACFTLISSTSA
eukprot:TRINITY_DN1107_c0_g1_i3.p1 TRINITY_DN1107_c0_g1~~TRINITY_DN1107_c0_g1_i3.p1  ORF type:complete len:6204 (+),score=1430.96 TRINITY_DN1107_c0_g1_i3:1580-18613(+)